MSTPTILSLWGKRKADEDPEVHEKSRQRTTSVSDKEKKFIFHCDLVMKIQAISSDLYMYLHPFIAIWL